MLACLSFCHSLFSKIATSAHLLPIGSQKSHLICLSGSSLQIEFPTPVITLPTPTACECVLPTSPRPLRMDSENLLTQLKVCSWNQQIHPVLAELGPLPTPSSNTYRSNTIYFQWPNSETEILFIWSKIWSVGITKDRDPNTYSTQERSGIYTKKSYSFLIPHTYFTFQK